MWLPQNELCCKCEVHTRFQRPDKKCHLFPFPFKIMAIRKFKITHVAHITFLLLSVDLESAENLIVIGNLRDGCAIRLVTRKYLNGRKD